MIQARWQSFWKLLGLLIVCNAIMTGFGNCASAQIVPDNTLGNEKSQVTNNPNILGLPAQLIEGGAIRGVNLFQSFSQFNVGNGELVYFANPPGIQNILSRVTGNDPSKIFGILGVNGNANLFLMNPNGIIFGQNARLDVAGSFVGTTASAFRFGEQGVFSATNPETPPLLTVNPSALLFNQLNPGAIANQGLLEVPDGKSLLLVGGNVGIDRGIITAFGGRVELGGLASPGTVGLGVDGNTLSLSFPENVTRANVSLRNRAVVGVNAAGSGSIAVNANNLDILERSGLLAGIEEGLGSVEAVAGDITLNATGEMKIVGGSVFNVVQPEAVGKGGNINVSAGSLSLTDGAGLFASTYGSGDAGNVSVRASDSVSLSSAIIGSTVESRAVGNGGNIDITAASLYLKGAQLGTFVRNASNNQPSGRGNAGNVNVNVTDTVVITGVKDGIPGGIVTNLGIGAIGKGGSINITTGSLSLNDRAILQASTYGQGDAGNVFVQAKDSVSLTGRSDIFSTVEPGAVGNGGNINITAATLSLTDGAQLGSFVRDAFNNQPIGQGKAGNINVNVTDTVMISGIKDGISSGIFNYLGTRGIGKGGSINISTGSLSLNDGAVVSTITNGLGDAGSVLVQAKDSVSVSNNSSILSFVESSAAGKGGNINITTGSLSLNDGAQVSTSTNGLGDAGSIFVQAKDSVSVSNNSLIFSLVQSPVAGKGGNINVTTGSLSVTDGSQLDASTFGRGDAGNIQINATDWVTVAGSNSITGRPSALFTDTNFTGKGGDIIVNTNVLRVSDGAVLNAPTTYDKNGGNGGNITVNANRVEVLNGGAFLAYSIGNGRAGKITVNATDKVIVSGSDPTYNDRYAKLGLFDEFGIDFVTNSFANFGFANSGFYVRSQGSGATGDIEVTSPQIRLDNQGRFNAESASGDGGNIILNSDLLLMRGKSSISTTAGLLQNAGNGGNITINSKFLVGIPQENSDIIANAFTGSGGKVIINTSGIFGFQPLTGAQLRILNTNSNPRELLTNDISAVSQQGGPQLDGQITINNPDVDPSNGLAFLPTDVFDPSNQIAQGCAAFDQANASDFKVTGRGGLPPSPDETLSSDAVWEDTRLLATTAQRLDSKTTATKPKSESDDAVNITPATGWVFNGKGEVTLVSHTPNATAETLAASSQSCRVR